MIFFVLIPPRRCTRMPHFWEGCAGGGGSIFFAYHGHYALCFHLEPCAAQAFFFYGGSVSAQIIFLCYSYACFWVDSTSRMVEWVGGWGGAIWDDLSSWTCPFPVGDMDRPFPVGGMDWPFSLTCCSPVHPV